MSQSALYYESRKKSALLALVLNLLCPGLGYVYCGAWMLGIAWLLVGPCLAIVGFIFLFTPLLPAGLFMIGAAIVLHPVSIVHVISVANAHNRRLADALAQDMAMPPPEHLNTGLDMP